MENKQENEPIRTSQFQQQPQLQQLQDYQQNQQHPEQDKPQHHLHKPYQQQEKPHHSQQQQKSLQKVQKFEQENSSQPLTSARDQQKQQRNPTKQLTQVEREYWQQRLPHGFQFYLERLARSVIRNQPNSILEFSAVYLEELLVGRNAELWKLPVESYFMKLFRKKVGSTPWQPHRRHLSPEREELFPSCSHTLPDIVATEHLPESSLPPEETSYSKSSDEIDKEMFQEQEGIIESPEMFTASDCLCNHKDAHENNSFQDVAHHTTIASATFDVTSGGSTTSFDNTEDAQTSGAFANDNVKDVLAMASKTQCQITAAVEYMNSSKSALAHEPRANKQMHKEECTQTMTENEMIEMEVMSATRQEKFGTDKELHKFSNKEYTTSRLVDTNICEHGNVVGVDAEDIKEAVKECHEVKLHGTNLIDHNSDEKRNKDTKGEKDKTWSLMSELDNVIDKCSTAGEDEVDVCSEVKQIPHSTEEISQKEDVTSKIVMDSTKVGEESLDLVFSKKSKKSCNNHLTKDYKTSVLQYQAAIEDIVEGSVHGVCVCTKDSVIRATQETTHDCSVKDPCSSPEDIINTDTGPESHGHTKTFTSSAVDVLGAEQRGLEEEVNFSDNPQISKVTGLHAGASLSTSLINMLSYQTFLGERETSKYLHCMPVRLDHRNMKHVCQNQFLGDLSEVQLTTEGSDVVDVSVTADNASSRLYSTKPGTKIDQSYPDNVEALATQEQPSETCHEMTSCPEKGDNMTSDDSCPHNFNVNEVVRDIPYTDVTDDDLVKTPRHSETVKTPVLSRECADNELNEFEEVYMKSEEIECHLDDTKDFVKAENLVHNETILNPGGGASVDKVSIGPTSGLGDFVPSYTKRPERRVSQNVNISPINIPLVAELVNGSAPVSLTRSSDLAPARCVQEFLDAAFRLTKQRSDISDKSRNEISVAIRESLSAKFENLCAFGSGVDTIREVSCQNVAPDALNVGISASGGSFDLAVSAESDRGILTSPEKSKQNTDDRMAEDVVEKITKGPPEFLSTSTKIMSTPTVLASNNCTLSETAKEEEDSDTCGPISDIQNEERSLNVDRSLIPKKCYEVESHDDSMRRSQEGITDKLCSQDLAETGKQNGAQVLGNATAQDTTGTKEENNKRELQPNQETAISAPTFCINPAHSNKCNSEYSAENGDNQNYITLENNAALSNSEVIPTLQDQDSFEWSFRPIQDAIDHEAGEDKDVDILARANSSVTTGTENKKSDGHRTEELTEKEDIHTAVKIESSVRQESNTVKHEQQTRHIQDGILNISDIPSVGYDTRNIFETGLNNESQLSEPQCADQVHSSEAEFKVGFSRFGKAETENHPAFKIHRSAEGYRAVEVHPSFDVHPSTDGYSSVEFQPSTKDYPFVEVHQPAEVHPSANIHSSAEIHASTKDYLSAEVQPHVEDDPSVEVHASTKGYSSAEVHPFVEVYSPSGGYSSSGGYPSAEIHQSAEVLPTEDRPSVEVYPSVKAYPSFENHMCAEDHPSAGYNQSDEYAQAAEIHPSVEDNLCTNSHPSSKNHPFSKEHPFAEEQHPFAQDHPPVEDYIFEEGCMCTEDYLSVQQHTCPEDQPPPGEEHRQACNHLEGTSKMKMERALLIAKNYICELEKVALGIERILESHLKTSKESQSMITSEEAHSVITIEETHSVKIAEETHHVITAEETHPEVTEAVSHLVKTVEASHHMTTAEESYPMRTDEDSHYVIRTDKPHPAMATGESHSVKATEELHHVKTSEQSQSTITPEKSHSVKTLAASYSMITTEEPQTDIKIENSAKMQIHSTSELSAATKATDSGSHFASKNLEEKSATINSKLALNVSRSFLDQISMKVVDIYQGRDDLGSVEGESQKACVAYRRENVVFKIKTAQRADDESISADAGVDGDGLSSLSESSAGDGVAKQPDMYGSSVDCMGTGLDFESTVDILTPAPGSEGTLNNNSTQEQIAIYSDNSINANSQESRKNNIYIQCNIIQNNTNCSNNSNNMDNFYINVNNNNRFYCNGYCRLCRGINVDRLNKHGKDSAVFHDTEADVYYEDILRHKRLDNVSVPQINTRSRRQNTNNNGNVVNLASQNFTSSATATDASTSNDEHCSTQIEKPTFLSKNGSTLSEKSSRLSKNGSTLSEKSSRLSKNGSTLSEKSPRLSKNGSTLSKKSPQRSKNGSTLSEKSLQLSKNDQVTDNDVLVIDGQKVYTIPRGAITCQSLKDHVFVGDNDQVMTLKMPPNSKQYPRSWRVTEKTDANNTACFVGSSGQPKSVHLVQTENDSAEPNNKDGESIKEPEQKNKCLGKRKNDNKCKPSNGNLFPNEKSDDMDIMTTDVAETNKTDKKKWSPICYVHTRRASKRNEENLLKIQQDDNLQLPKNNLAENEKYELDQEPPTDVRDTGRKRSRCYAQGRTNEPQKEDNFLETEKNGTNEPPDNLSPNEDIGDTNKLPTDIVNDFKVCKTKRSPRCYVQSRKNEPRNEDNFVEKETNSTNEPHDTLSPNQDFGDTNNLETDIANDGKVNKTKRSPRCYVQSRNNEPRNEDNITETQKTDKKEPQENIFQAEECLDANGLPTDIGDTKMDNKRNSSTTCYDQSPKNEPINAENVEAEKNGNGKAPNNVAQNQEYDDTNQQLFGIADGNKVNKTKRSSRCYIQIKKNETRPKEPSLEIETGDTNEKADTFSPKGKCESENKQPSETESNHVISRKWSPFCYLQRRKNEPRDEVHALEVETNDTNDKADTFSPKEKCESESKQPSATESSQVSSKKWSPFCYLQIRKSEPKNEKLSLETEKNDTNEQPNDISSNEKNENHQISDNVESRQVINRKVSPFCYVNRRKNEPKTEEQSSEIEKNDTNEQSNNISLIEKNENHQIYDNVKSRQVINKKVSPFCYVNRRKNEPKSDEQSSEIEKNDTNEQSNNISLIEKNENHQISDSVESRQVISRKVSPFCYVNRRKNEPKTEEQSSEIEQNDTNEQSNNISLIEKNENHQISDNVESRQVINRKVSPFCYVNRRKNEPKTEEQSSEIEQNDTNEQSNNISLIEKNENQQISDNVESRQVINRKVSPFCYVNRRKNEPKTEEQSSEIEQNDTNEQSNNISLIEKNENQQISDNVESRQVINKKVSPFCYVNRRKNEPKTEEQSSEIETNDTNEKLNNCSSKETCERENKQSSDVAENGLFNSRKWSPFCYIQRRKNEAINEEQSLESENLENNEKLNNISTNDNCEGEDKKLSDTENSNVNSQVNSRKLSPFCYVNRRKNEPKSDEQSSEIEKNDINEQSNNMCLNEMNENQQISDNVESRQVINRKVSPFCYVNRRKNEPKTEEQSSEIETDDTNEKLNKCSSKETCERENKQSSDAAESGLFNSRKWSPFCYVQRKKSEPINEEQSLESENTETNEKLNNISTNGKNEGEDKQVCDTENSNVNSQVNSRKLSPFCYVSRRKNEPKTEHALEIEINDTNEEPYNLSPNEKLEVENQQPSDTAESSQVNNRKRSPFCYVQSRRKSANNENNVLEIEKVDSDEPTKKCSQNQESEDINKLPLDTSDTNKVTKRKQSVICSVQSRKKDTQNVDNFIEKQKMGTSEPPTTVSLDKNCQGANKEPADAADSKIRKRSHTSYVQSRKNEPLTKDNLMETEKNTSEPPKNIISQSESCENTKLPSSKKADNCERKNNPFCYVKIKKNEKIEEHDNEKKCMMVKVTKTKASLKKNSCLVGKYCADNPRIDTTKRLTNVECHNKDNKSYRPESKAIKRTEIRYGQSLTEDRISISQTGTMQEKMLEPEYPNKMNFPMRVRPVSKETEADYAPKITRRLTVESPLENFLVHTSFIRPNPKKRPAENKRNFELTSQRKRLYLDDDEDCINTDGTRRLICETEYFSSKDPKTKNLVVENGTSDVMHATVKVVSGKVQKKKKVDASLASLGHLNNSTEVPDDGPNIIKEKPTSWQKNNSIRMVGNYVVIGRATKNGSIRKLLAREKLTHAKSSNKNKSTNALHLAQVANGNCFSAPSSVSFTGHIVTDGNGDYFILEKSGTSINNQTTSGSFGCYHREMSATKSCQLAHECNTYLKDVVSNKESLISCTDTSYHQRIDISVSDSSIRHLYQSKSFMTSCSDLKTCAFVSALGDSSDCVQFVKVILPRESKSAFAICELNTNNSFTHRVQVSGKKAKNVIIHRAQVCGHTIININIYRPHVYEHNTNNSSSRGDQEFKERGRNIPKEASQILYVYEKRLKSRSDHIEPENGTSVTSLLRSCTCSGQQPQNCVSRDEQTQVDVRDITQTNEAQTGELLNYMPKELPRRYPKDIANSRGTVFRSGKSSCSKEDITIFANSDMGTQVNPNDVCPSDEVQTGYPKEVTGHPFRDHTVLSCEHQGIETKLRAYEFGMQVSATDISVSGNVQTESNLALNVAYQEYTIGRKEPTSSGKVARQSSCEFCPTYSSSGASQSDAQTQVVATDIQAADVSQTGEMLLLRENFLPSKQATNEEDFNESEVNWSDLSIKEMTRVHRSVYAQGNKHVGTIPPEQKQGLGHPPDLTTMLDQQYLTYKSE